MKKKEDFDMNTLKKRLEIANDNINKILPDIWKQAEENLKKLEEEYHKKKGRKN
mgnify:CR=1 FL=1|jgi:hypothetical protein